MDPDSRVFLGMPGYSSLTGGASRAFWRATRLPEDRVYYSQSSGSLLGYNFNALWSQALTLEYRGSRIDHFAMQHADIEPPDYWLDDLIAELEARDLDVLGVAVPIKTHNGLTSIALDRPDGDTWRPLCRLTLAEIHRLPETFTSEDVGHPLLINTGLWVCRFDPSWARKVRFTINDRIVFRTDLDAFVPQVEPEDWYFSRLCHELKLRLGVTRKIPLVHRGDAGYSNAHPWGDTHDSAWLDRSLIH